MLHHQSDVSSSNKVEPETLQEQMQDSILSLKSLLGKFNALPQQSLEAKMLCHSLRILLESLEYYQEHTDNSGETWWGARLQLQQRLYDESARYP